MSKMRRLRDAAYAILKPMKGGKKARGFTIAETMVVLGVTGALFTVVAVTLSGRQAKTEFEQSVNEIRSQIQQVINDVNTGYYPNSGNFSCSAGAFGPSLTSGAVNQGENTGCIFLGKAIQFRVDGTGPEQFNIITIAGLQRTSTGGEVTTYAQAMPRAVSPATASPSIPDGVEKKKLQHGLTIVSATYGASNTPIGAIAFMNSLASYTSGTIVSGSQQVNLVPVVGSALGTDQQAAAQAINTGLGTSPVNPANGVRLCFVAGGISRSGLITIGTSTQQLTVNLSIRGNKTCA